MVSTCIIIYYLDHCFYEVKLLISPIGKKIKGQFGINLLLTCSVFLMKKVTFTRT